jgi:hypothetical protein
MNPLLLPLLPGRNCIKFENKNNVAYLKNPPQPTTPTTVADMLDPPEGLRIAF